MAYKFTEIGRSEPCPCGSGKKYGKCCARKKFSFGRDPEGNLVKQLTLSEELRPFLEDVADDYRRLYGRDAEPHDLVFAFRMNPAESPIRTVPYLRAAGVPEDIIYAYCRTDGLLPVEGHLDVHSEADLAEFTAYRDEYDRLMRCDIAQTAHPSALWYVSTGNDLIGDAARTATEHMQMVLNDFLSRHEVYGGFVNFELRTPLDYCLFSAYKTSRTLDSISRLAGYGMPEAIYALSRGLFENYLYLNAVATDSDFFRGKILPKADRENYTFDVNNGRINYNRVVHHTTGEKIVVSTTLTSLLGYTAKISDHELYDLFYRTACQFVHVDVLSARAYFHEPDPFDELDQGLLAWLISVVLTGMIVQALGGIPGVDERFSSDVAFFLNALRDTIMVPIQLADADPEHKNAVYETLISIVEGWRMSS